MPSSSDTTLDRLIRILSAFDTTTPRLTVQKLSSQADIPLASTYRWVDRLVEAQLLHRHRNGEISAGIKLWELASRAAPTTSLRAAAMPFLNDVQAVLQQHTQLAVLDDEGVLILERLSARNAVVNQAVVAGRMPLFTTSLGRVLLAASPHHVTEEMIAAHRDDLRAPGEKETSGPGAKPSIEELRAVLAEVRRTGYAVVPGQTDSHTTGVAVPVVLPKELGPTGRPAALGVVVPRETEALPGIPPLLKATSRAITRSLENTPPQAPYRDTASSQ